MSEGLIRLQFTNVEHLYMKVSWKGTAKIIQHIGSFWNINFFILSTYLGLKRDFAKFPDGMAKLFNGLTTNSISNMNEVMAKNVRFDFFSSHEVSEAKKYFKNSFFILYTLKYRLEILDKQKSLLEDFLRDFNALKNSELWFQEIFLIENFSWI